MKVIYMGTPKFSVPAFERIIKDGHNVCLVITQPDKKSGRGKKIQISALKEAAINCNTEIYQPENINDEASLNYIRTFNADIMVVASYGQILSKQCLELTPFGAVNIHASLLPKYRGASPIQAAIKNMDKTSGISIMKMHESLDSGAVMIKKEIYIENLNSEELSYKLSLVGADAISEALKLIEQGNACYEEQDENRKSYVGIIKKRDALLNFNKDARAIEAFIRAMYPWPVAYTSYKGKIMKIYEATVVEGKYEPGLIKKVGDEGILVGTLNSALLIKRIQMPDKKVMEVKDFIKGNKIEEGIYLGDEKYV